MSGPTSDCGHECEARSDEPLRFPQLHKGIVARAGGIARVLSPSVQDTISSHAGTVKAANKLVSTIPLAAVPLARLYIAANK